MDAHSKWEKVVEMTHTTTAETIAALRNLFALHGIPEWIVSDNRIQLNSSDFKEFKRRNGIKHLRSSLYNPSSNGEAEWFFRTFKEGMEAAKNNDFTLAHQLDNFLLSYRTIPLTTTGTPPFELLIGRSMCTRWYLLRPDVEQQVGWRGKKPNPGMEQLTFFFETGAFTFKHVCWFLLLFLKMGCPFPSVLVIKRKEKKMLIIKTPNHL